jgi:hypothetical protein
MLGSWDLPPAVSAEFHIPASGGSVLEVGALELRAAANLPALCVDAGLQSPLYVMTTAAAEPRALICDWGTRSEQRALRLETMKIGHGNRRARGGGGGGCDGARKGGGLFVGAQERRGART